MEAVTMAFMRRRPSSKGRCSHQVLESFREYGQVRKRTLLNLGPHATLQHTLEDARCRRTYNRIAELMEFQAQHPQAR
jgi:hypothetical protein